MFAIFVNAFADFVIYIFTYILFAAGFGLIIVLYIYNKIADAIEKHADRVGLVLGPSIMAAGAIFFVVGTTYHLFS